MRDEIAEEAARLDEKYPDLTYMEAKVAEEAERAERYKAALEGAEALLSAMVWRIERRGLPTRAQLDEARAWLGAYRKEAG